MDRASRISLAKHLTTAMAFLVKANAKQIRRESVRRKFQRDVKQSGAELVRTLEPFFESQIKAYADRLQAADAALKAEQVFDLTKLDEELINRTLPLLAKRMFKTSMEEYLQSKAKIKSIKAESTATEWLDSVEDAALESIEFITPLGIVTLQISTEFPDMMKQDIVDRLQETFAQDYWTKVNQTTLADIDGFLEEGLVRGQSIREIAKNIIPNLMEQGKYAKVRARRIAITESANALNGARVAAMNTVERELEGSGLPIRKVWMSILIPTTRDAHANLDGVPCTKDGYWFLGGVKARWPGDVNLPADQRINCYCTVLHQFGLADAEADELLAEYERQGGESTDEGKFTEPLPAPEAGVVLPQVSRAQVGGDAWQAEKVQIAKAEGFPEKLKAFKTGDRAIEELKKLDAIDEAMEAVTKSIDPLYAQKAALLKEEIRLEDLVTAAYEANDKSAARRLTRELVKIRNEKSGISRQIDDAYNLRGRLRGQKSSLAKSVVSGEDQIEVRLVEHESSKGTGVLSEALGGRLQFERLTQKGIIDSDDFALWVHRTTDDRAFYSNHGIHLNENVSSTTVVHEIAHHIEYQNPRAAALSKEFITIRTQKQLDARGGVLRKIADEFPDAGFRDYEVSRGDDDWAKTFEILGKGGGKRRAWYAGKDYGDVSTEIITQGIEVMVEDPTAFAKSDPEFFKFIYGVLQGAF